MSVDTELGTSIMAINNAHRPREGDYIAGLLLKEETVVLVEYYPCYGGDPTTN